MNVEPEYHLRKLKSSLIDCLISKENAIAVKEKKVSELNFETRKNHLVSLESELACEEDLSHRIRQAFQVLGERNLKEDWKNQIKSKKLFIEEEKAEAAIDSLESKIKDRNYFQEIEREKEECHHQDLNEFVTVKEKWKELEMNKEEERDALHEIIEERRQLIKELQEECEKQSEERKKLEKCFITADLGISLHKSYCKKEELKNLRLEEDILIKEVNERKEFDKKNEKARVVEELVRQEREDQIRLKEKLRSEEKAREKEYVEILTEVMAEEAGLDSLRSAVANRKRREHFIVSQKILDERKKRRRETAKEELLQTKVQKELTELRNSILEEEERRLLLAYLPHLGPFLSPYVITKLSLL